MSKIKVGSITSAGIKSDLIYYQKRCNLLMEQLQLHKEKEDKLREYIEDNKSKIKSNILDGYAMGMVDLEELSKIDDNFNFENKLLQILDGSDE